MRGQEHIENFPTNRLCDVMDLSPRVLRTFRICAVSRRQRSDLI
jgi:hypothetical protein